jgi:hypothetical protein
MSKPDWKLQEHVTPNAGAFTSFLTGSCAYGTPREDSDTDLVVLVSHDTLDALAALADNQESVAEKREYSGGGLSLRFGKLNLICVTDPLHFKVWLQGTKELEFRKPVTRDQAVEHLRALRTKFGIKF